jgi:tRNA-splicing ligase RtcB
MTTDVARSIERLAAAEDVRHVAVMPDVHLAGDVCIGSVVATARTVVPAAVGGDIGCGTAAVGFEMPADRLDNEHAAARLLSGLYDRVPVIRHSAETAPDRLPHDLERSPLSTSRLDKLKHRDGRVQFGTLGRGNHFLEFQADQQGQLWLMVHSGSRAMGQAITAHHVACAAARSSEFVALDAESEPGRAYLADADWAARYATQNRLTMVSSVAGLMEDLFQVKVDWRSLIHASHNHVRREQHFGQFLWVHRKGAQSARSGEMGIIPGSMGTASFHVAGRGHEDALCSSSHGAGRTMSRTQARRCITARQLHRQMGAVWFDHRRDQNLREEAPDAYKDIHAVLRAQRELVRIVRQLRPILSYKG